jgi:hypothetical protein
MAAILNLVYKIPEDGTEFPEHVAVVKVYIVGKFVTCALTWI